MALQSVAIVAVRRGKDQGCQKPAVVWWRANGFKDSQKGNLIASRTNTRGLPRLIEEISAEAGDGVPSLLTTATFNFAAASTVCTPRNVGPLAADLTDPPTRSSASPTAANPLPFLFTLPIHHLSLCISPPSNPSPRFAQDTWPSLKPCAHS
ncbi:hypothetical protein K490DRAFT_66427 [Saccharata proteae CBS 121410]|uniref:Uncharacterized protein n=1 Tax=Saccharata proteae CBS 121410 TaxID=1314787 RepID=A0A9P4HWQ6_9PEZI|nr:hypothetical protein K490DRAFT_66427 [Saccharata proteae CBS 121410]